MEGDSLFGGLVQGFGDSLKELNDTVVGGLAEWASEGIPRWVDEEVFGSKAVNDPSDASLGKPSSVAENPLPPSLFAQYQPLLLVAAAGFAVVLIAKRL